MRDLQESGSDFVPNGDWNQETPENPTLEQRLAASVYLAELGYKGSIEDIAYRLSVDLAKARHANKTLHDLMGAEVERYRSRWLLERELASDTIAEGECQRDEIALLKAQADYSVSALITCQERLDNCLRTVDDLSPLIDWNEAFDV